MAQMNLFMKQKQTHRHRKQIYDYHKLVVKNLPANAGEIRDVSLIPGSGRSPGGEHGNPLLCSCLENPMDREAWWATVYGVKKSQTRLEMEFVGVECMCINQGVMSSV